MGNAGDRFDVPTVPMATGQKRLGMYLVEAGLITADQIQVVLNDQQATGMKFGEVLVARGWCKERTIEWIMEKVIIPERRNLYQRRQDHTLQQYLHKQRPHSAGAGRLQQTSAAFTENTTGAEKTIVQDGTTVQDGTKIQAPTPKTFVRRDAPIAKPLPPVNSSDSDVSWVG